MGIDYGGFMEITDQQIEDVIKKIKSIKEYEGLCSYTKKMLDYLKDSDTTYTENKVVACKYKEELKIEIDPNEKYFDITIPSWNSTDISEFKYKKINNLSMFNYQRNIKLHEGNNCWNYHYLYENDLLIYVDGKNDITFDNPKYQSRNKCEQNCFYIINRRQILKKVMKNSKTSYFIIDLNFEIEFENMDFADFNRLDGVLVSGKDLEENIDNIDKKIKIFVNNQKNKMEV